LNWGGVPDDELVSDVNDNDADFILVRVVSELLFLMKAGMSPSSCANKYKEFNIE
jgi:hypothetical protein